MIVACPGHTYLRVALLTMYLDWSNDVCENVRLNRIVVAIYVCLFAFMINLSVAIQGL